MNLAGLAWKGVIFCGVMLLALWVATQWVASGYGYDERLGGRLFSLGRIGVFAPWRYIIWVQHGLLGATGAKGVWICLIGMVCATRTIALLDTSASPQKGKVHGSATWGDWKTLKRAKLFAKGGVVLGKTADGQILQHDGPQHIAVIAPTRTGKSLGISIPTLLEWQGSAIVLDVKSELFNVTSGYRSTFSRVIYYNPTDARTARFNPLLEIRAGVSEVRDAQNIADMVVDPHGQGLEGENEFWKSKGRAFLVAAILHVFHTKPDKSLYGVTRLLADPTRRVADTLKEMLAMESTIPWGGSVIAQGARELEDMAEETQRDVIATALHKLDLFKEPLLRAATSSSDFCIDELMNACRPTTLYLAIPPSDIDRLRPILRLVLNQILRRLTEQSASTQRLQKLLLLLDEFHLLGRMDFFDSALAFIAGYGIKSVILTQSINQLQKAYGKEHSLLENVHLKVFFTPSTLETASLISNTLGKTTIGYRSRSTNARLFSILPSTRSDNMNWISRELLTPDELLKLPFECSLILANGESPIMAHKLFYANEKRYASKILPACAFERGAELEPFENPRVVSPRAAIESPAKVPAQSLLDQCLTTARVH